MRRIPHTYALLAAFSPVAAIRRADFPAAFQQCSRPRQHFCTARRTGFVTPRSSRRWHESLTLRHISTGEEAENGKCSSVTGVIYGPADEDSKSLPVVQLYTKEGCTLCDKVAAVLRDTRETHPHTLEAVDITDEDKQDWFSKYKWDIPVLHIDGKYWAKHRITSEEAAEGLQAAAAGSFEEQCGEPDAAEMERRQAERQNT